MKIYLVAALAASTLGLAGSAYAQDAGSERVVITHPAITTSSVVVSVPVSAAWKKAGGERAIVGGGSGGIGGAIGGYYINGTTPSDNRLLPGSTWPYR